MLTAPYRILRFHRDWPCLLCLVCNRWSYTPTDVQQRYCRWCHLFLDDLPEAFTPDLPAGRSPGRRLAGEEPEPEEAPPPPPLPWERPAFPPPRQPWDTPVPPAIAACGLCDVHGLADLETPDGTRLAARCCHDPGAMQAFAERHAWELVRRDRSREPPAPPAEGGPGG